QVAVATTTPAAKPDKPAPKTKTASSKTTTSKTTTSKAVVDDDPASRRPTGGGWFDVPEPTPTPASPPVVTPPVVTPPPPSPSPPGVSGTGGPIDPYGGDTPADTGAPEKKAEFFANLGAQ